MRTHPLRILIVTPAPAHSRAGNRVTALRWARILRTIGHRVVVAEHYRAQRCDVLVALHARKSCPAVRAFAAAHPDRPIVLALTGTDLYDDIHHDADARRALELATRLVVLQDNALLEVPGPQRARARVIHQSVPRWRRLLAKPRDRFQVCVLGHLRDVKDPFRAALAAALLPKSSRVRVVQAGAVLERRMRAEARRLMRQNPRYRWVGELSRARALALLRTSHLLVLSSRMEGGANVISEALAAQTPVLASRIPGSVGLLGETYPGYFPVGDTRTLAALIARCETEPRFHDRLLRACSRRAPLVEPARELEAWRRLLAELRAG